MSLAVLGHARNLEWHPVYNRHAINVINHVLYKTHHVRHKIFRNFFIAESYRGAECKLGEKKGAKGAIIMKIKTKQKS